MNPRSSFAVLGRLIANIPWTFYGCGRMPSQVKIYPRYSTSWTAKFDLSMLIYRSFAIMRWITCSTTFRCSLYDPFVMIKR